MFPAQYTQKGMKRIAGAGRKAGTRNRVTSVLKECILAAAEQVGRPVYDKKKKRFILGEGGLQGYLVHLALAEPKSFAGLLGRVLPLQITGEGGGPIRFIDESMSPQDAAQAYAEALRAQPMMIDVTPERGRLARYVPGSNGSNGSTNGSGE